VFTHGSYRNRVNVRRDSDVDVGVLCDDVFLPTYPQDVEGAQLGHTDASYTYAQFKRDVYDALSNYFGSEAVTWGNKAFDLHETSYHVEADVAPFVEHRRYVSDRSYHSGVGLLPDSGGRIVNWPEQHYENGVEKNNATKRSYKGLVRILKSLRLQMEDSNPAAKALSGFVVECLTWNVPNELIIQSTWTETVKSAVAHLWYHTHDEARCSEWGEVSELKYLFRSQPDRRRNSNLWLSAVWDVLGF
jgi:hypothetical protein